MERIDRRRIAQGTSGLRVHDLKVGVSRFPAKFGATKKAKLSGHRMLTTPKSDPKEIVPKPCVPVMRRIVEAPRPARNEQ